MSEDTLSIVAANEVPFTVRIVREGDRYGLEGRAVHEGPEPLVEFYDARYDFTPGLGQFVSRYGADVFLGKSEWSRPAEPGQGLVLYGGEPDWEIDFASLGRVKEWVGARLDPAASPAP